MASIMVVKMEPLGKGFYKLLVCGREVICVSVSVRVMDIGFVRWLL